ncbi:MAG: response regulator [Deltaproteobacteria bacterium]|nr:response regulator [Deltaproteobacteria bacterium]
MEKFYSHWQLSETPRVLLADDSISNRVQIKQLLRHLDIQIIEAETGRETVKLVSQGEFGAILLDLDMPDMNGFDTAEHIVREGFAPNTPIIILSGATMNENQLVRGYETGAVDSIHWSDLPIVLPAKLKFYLNYYRQKKDLESTNQTKSEFLSNMSHELRTPLNSILVLAQLLSENSERNLSDKQLKFANTIYSSGTDLLNLINEILDLSKVESGMMEFVIDDMNVKHFISDTARKIRHTALRKGLGFDVSVAPSVPRIIQADSVRVNQILNNLLSNAIKFTSSGRVTLNVFLPDESIVTPSRVLAPGEAIAFAVTDTGIGVPADKKHLIFEAFRQVDGSIRRKYGGTGLGLSISKKLALIMGGELIFRSQEGQGSTFVLYLPVFPEEKDAMPDAGNYANRDGASGISVLPDDVTSEARESGLSVSADVMSVLSGKRVLLVEDDIINVFVMLSLLDKVNMQVIVAAGGLEAIEKLTAEKVDLILMDMMMPEMDGYEATQKIKAESQYAHLPIIAVTAKAMKGDRDKCFLAGVDGYITKPVLAEALFSEIFACLTRA